MATDCFKRIHRPIIACTSGHVACPRQITQQMHHLQSALFGNTTAQNVQTMAMLGSGCLLGTSQANQLQPIHSRRLSYGSGWEEPVTQFQYPWPASFAPWVRQTLYPCRVAKLPSCQVATCPTPHFSGRGGLAAMRPTHAQRSLQAEILCTWTDDED